MEYRTLLGFPISLLYSAAVLLRARLYKRGLLPVEKLARPVISVGNLSMGGTGKTPTVIALGRILQEQGLKISVLSRGYRGRYSGDCLVVADGEKLLSNAQEAGDEPVIISKNLPGAVVCVSKKRSSAGRTIESRFPVDLHLLDDGFQHLSLHRLFNLLLIDVSRPWAGGMPPWGRRREPLSAIGRADAVLLTRCQPGLDYGPIVKTLRRHHPDVQLFHASQQLGQWVKFSSEGGQLEVRPVGERVLAVSGIGHPAQFLDSLRQEGIVVAGSLNFPDHHAYAAVDYQKIADSGHRLGVKAIVTTEKDAVRLDISALSPWPVWVPSLEMIIEEKQQLLDHLLSAISSRVS
jgi:tetraacyldisaccharide 4'-kinase